MFSQSISAQLLRLLLALIVTLVAVQHCQPLLDALAQHATSGGCHQQSPRQPSQNNPDTQHKEHH
ncbi:hypothetical protein [Shewanella sp. NIFS-20-20]|uniref:hypothetical protein n=1 Tax=Shewanella sp. NIFS-20-20 TaxID=2853806 RepID=UPI001C4816CA|nr:hypothetical protein [Shewanella sp. NIFS-20-20]MBV7317476.1 hypothetical protein [Shewanella sp. NIFS-20-20]